MTPRSYVLLGDPAVRLCVSNLEGAKTGTGEDASRTAPPSVTGAGSVPGPASSTGSGSGSGSGSRGVPPPPGPPPGPGPRGVHFDVPQGYRDLTNYTFQDPDGGRRLTVLPITGLASDDDLRKAVEQYRTQAEEIFKARDVAETEIQKRPDGASVATLSFTFDQRTSSAEPGKTYREQAGFIRFPNGEALQVSYVSARRRGGRGRIPKVARQRPAGPTGRGAEGRGVQRRGHPGFEHGAAAGRTAEP